MTELQQAFCDGASFAYNDAANKIDSMIENAPGVLRAMMSSLAPLSEALRIKARAVHEECERFMGDRQ